MAPIHPPAPVQNSNKSIQERTPVVSICVGILGSNCCFLPRSANAEREEKLHFSLPIMEAHEAVIKSETLRCSWLKSSRESRTPFSCSFHKLFPTLQSSWTGSQQMQYYVAMASTAWRRRKRFSSQKEIPIYRVRSHLKTLCR